MARRGGRAQSAANAQSAASLKATMQAAAREEELARRALWEMEYQQRGGEPGDTEFPKLDAANYSGALFQADTNTSNGDWGVVSGEGYLTWSSSQTLSMGANPRGATTTDSFGTRVDSYGNVIQGPAKVRFGPPPGRRVSPNHADGRLEAAEHYPVDDPIGWLHRRVSEVTELAPMLGGARG